MAALKEMGDCWRCPFDGGLIPAIGLDSGIDDSGVSFYWCCFCWILVAVVNGQEVVSFADRNRSGAWSVWKIHGPEKDVAQAREARKTIGPVTTLRVTERR